MINPNEPAFPDPARSREQTYKVYPSGLTIREYMATKFMAAWIQSYSAGSISGEELAKYSVNSADALIAELDKQANTNI